MESPLSCDLFTIFARLADPRGRMGRRHNLPALLAGVTCGILAGARSLKGITQWFHDQEASFRHELVFFALPRGQQILDAEGDSLFTVKDNQPDLKSALEADFEPGSPRYRGQTPATA